MKETDAEFLRLEDTTKICEGGSLRVVERIGSSSISYIETELGDDDNELYPADLTVFVRLSFMGVNLFSRRFPTYSRASYLNPGDGILNMDEKRIVLVGPELKDYACNLCLIVQDSSISLGTLMRLKGDYYIYCVEVIVKKKLDPTDLFKLFHKSLMIKIDNIRHNI